YEPTRSKFFTALLNSTGLMQTFALQLSCSGARSDSGVLGARCTFTGNNPDGFSQRSARQYCSELKPDFRFVRKYRTAG
ncbi:TPA: hypothetical protein ACPIAT_006834, partial [Pseudomonas aeruginosa]